MEKELHEQYEYARKRLNQKKIIYFHFVLLILGSLFMYIANNFSVFEIKSIWVTWLITFWVFLFVLHFIKVFITDRFMNKNWERNQIDRLIVKQQEKIHQLQNQIEEESSKNP